MNKTTIYSTMADDARLVQIFQEAEHNRCWIWRLDWWRIFGWVAALAWSAVVWTLLLALGKHFLWRYL